MREATLSCLLVCATMAGIVRPVRADDPPAAGDGITPARVNAAIERGVVWLKSKQNPDRGNWPEYPTQPGGLTALCTLALLNAGVEVKDPAIQKALRYLRSLGKPTRTYSTALQTMAFCAAEPRKDMLLIRRNALWLQSIQIAKGPMRGAWAYGASGKQPGGRDEISTRGDASNSQFALLALHEAHRAGVEVQGRTWRLALDFWQRTQHADGSWGYYPNQPPTGSMTCAGISSLVIASGTVHRGDATVEGERVRCCGQQQQDDHLERALGWLGRNFSVTSNPNSSSRRDPRLTRRWILYYLYGVERVGRFTGQRFIGRADWYREGAAMLVAQQDGFTGFWTGGEGEANPILGTSLALLFLSKGRRPVVIAKLKHDPSGDWNHHRRDVANLTAHVEKKWRRELTWQVIDPHTASVESLLQSPVLFLNGRDALDFNADVKRNLRTYIDQGGFIFAEACCDDSQAFDRDFRRLMAELFPDSPLRLLGADHPVWFAEEKVNPKYLRKLYGVDACCRTSVIYSPEKISCYWQLGGPGPDPGYPAAVKDEIAACKAIGANVLAYATGRELRDKLDKRLVLSSEGVEQPPARGTLQVAKLRHSGGSDDAPAALSNLLRVVGNQLSVRVNTERRLVAIDDPKLADYPVAFMHGRRSFRLTQQERKALAAYLQRGGFLMVDSICANEQFTQSFRDEMAAIFPDTPLRRIDAKDPLLSREFRGYDLSTVTLRDPKFRTEGDPLKARLYRTAPRLEVLEIDGRYAVVFSPYDISCAMENSPSLECKGYTRADAAKIGVNVILYALQQ